VAKNFWCHSRASNVSFVGPPGAILHDKDIFFLIKKKRVLPLLIKKQCDTTICSGYQLQSEAKQKKNT
jgi:hypothetical protein